MQESDELLAIRAAELYYEEDKTQDEIGQLLMLTRWKVGRLLAQAKDRGYIRIEIVHPRARRPVLERRLRDELGLEDAVVVSAAGVSRPEEVQTRTAQAAADYLASLRPAPRVLGVSWGRTISEVAADLRPGWASGVSVVQLNGGVSFNRFAGTAAAAASMIAQKGGGSATLLPSPAILEHVETKRAIETDRVVAGVLDLAANADVSLFSAGSADHGSVHIDSGYLTAGDLDALVAGGAVGDVVGRYLDAEGRIVDTSLDERTIGVTLDRLRSAPRTIAVIAGRAKHPVAAAVVRSGICRILVTDEETALHLLDGSASADPSATTGRTPE
ncbi:sugar-binding transcriptional regulator [Agromyces seonyuensis]|uniref:Sugar-binding transcriptional regulator n=1 Tax=Agromyces seonyuensis TaxID=2662446 RepID=A0A6I4P044_9MICO|nr:sugar-binding transcriptional regulator [Agromyces seonyuensis]MWB99761.1 sugar-binding transcriptional regulator [Agromyces seonyuensis]